MNPDVPREPAGPPSSGCLARNIVAFARVLRDAGLPIGVDQSIAAVRAVDATGVERRDDVHAALSATLLSRREQQPVFDAAFDAFWRDPARAGLLPSGTGRRAPSRPARVDEALGRDTHGATPSPLPDDDAVRTEAATTWSDREHLHARDFESMTVDEFRAALRLAREVPDPIEPVPVRRWQPSQRGPIDLRATLRRVGRTGSIDRPARRARRERPAPLVILCDVSGSMDRYARVLLHWAHALVRMRPRVAVFTFGTRLTDVTRALRRRDPDEALQAAAQAVSDWGGGTRIGPSLARFNRLWARRLLTGRASVLLATDGLDRADDGSLGAAAATLARFAHRLVWLNPLLRYDGFEPRAAGVRALLPHVDLHLPVHSLDRLDDLRRVLRTA